jgi:hypothetical protein
MSRLQEIQNQYQGYVAARNVVEKTDPKDVEVVYKSHGNYSADESLFIYSSKEDHIKIKPRRGNVSNYICIETKDIPPLIKALREFVE